MDLHRHYIGGEWAAGADGTENINPSDTRDVVGLYAQASRAQAGEFFTTVKTACVAP